MSALDQAIAPPCARAVIRDIHIGRITHSGRGKQLTPTEQEHLIRIYQQHKGDSDGANLPKRFWRMISDQFSTQTGRSYSWQSCRRRMTDLELKLKQQSATLTINGSDKDSPGRDSCSQHISPIIADSPAAEISVQQTTPLSCVSINNINKPRQQSGELEGKCSKLQRIARGGNNQTSLANSPHPPPTISHLSRYPQPRSRSRSPHASAKKPYRSRSPLPDNTVRSVTSKANKPFDDVHGPDTSESDDAISLPETPVKPIRRPLSESETPAGKRSQRRNMHSGRLSDKSNIDLWDIMSNTLRMRAMLDLDRFCSSIIFGSEDEELLTGAVDNLVFDLEKATDKFKERIRGGQS